MVAGELCDGQDDFTWAMVFGALLHWDEAAFPADGKKVDAGPVIGGDGAFDGVAFQVGNGPDDAHAGDTGHNMQGVRSGVGSLFS